MLFICTANNLFDIPAPLRDRLEVIQIAGYTIEEKVEIAWRYLLPKLLRGARHHRQGHPVHGRDAGLISSGYSREAGLRSFERNIAAIMRKRARKKADGEEGAWIVDLAKVEEVLGSPRYAKEEAETEPEIGTVTGMAWTSYGRRPDGDRGARMPGTGKLTVTGQLGDVMRESVDAALSYVRSRVGAARDPRREFKDYDIHIHFPAGAIPKDGPSAGITVTLAIASALRGARGAARCGDDGRGHAARQGAGDRRHEGEDAWRRIARGCAK